MDATADDVECSDYMMMKLNFANQEDADLVLMQFDLMCYSDMRDSPNTHSMKTMMELDNADLCEDNDSRLSWCCSFVGYD